MKVCPYCNGITEENNAIKCQVCGMDISCEKEFSKEELEDELIQDELETLRKERSRKKLLKKLGIVFGLIFVLLTFVFVYSLLQPKGYVNINISSYNMNIGETIEIKLEYGDSISDKDIQVEILDSLYDGKKISFRYKIEDGTCYITSYMKDQITLQFNVKDNGEQYKYNNKVKITME